MTDDRNALAIDVLAFADGFDGGFGVLGKVLEARRLRSATALPDAALVVSQHHETAIRERVGKLTKDWNAEDIFVAIGRLGTADEDHSGQLPRGVRRLRNGTGQREPIGGNPNVLIVRARHRHEARRYR